MLQVARAVMADSGVRGFWQGNLAKCVESFPAKGMNFFGYELFKKVFAEVRAALSAPLRGGGMGGGF